MTDTDSASAGATSASDVGAAISDPASQVGTGANLRCNGYTALCDRRFDQVVFPAAHNAMASADDWWFAPNQVHGMKRALEDGIRALLIDTYRFLGDSYLCHRNCWLGAKKLVEGLREVATFMRGHPHEVLTLFIEDYIGSAETEIAFRDSGLASMTYVHLAGSAWPTLRSMIETGQRVLVMAEQGHSPPAWYHNAWDLVQDTPYAFSTASEFSCRLNRGQASNSLFLLNHWMESPLPDQSLSMIANARDVLLTRARQCQREVGKLPNFVAVNHYSLGDLFSVVRELNGL